MPRRKRSEAVNVKALDGVGEEEKAKAKVTALDLVKSAQPSPMNGPQPMMPKAYERITERILDLDPEQEYDRLERALELNESLTPNNVRAAANAAEANALKAHELYVHATVALERFRIDNDLVQSAMRDAATADLQAEKDSGQRSKQITEADVRGRAAVLYPDEWRAAVERRVRAENMHANIARLASLWEQRARTLGAMLKH